MATVFLAHDLRHDRSVALKVLKRDMDLVRKIMFAVEEAEPAALRRKPLGIKGYDLGTVAGHVKLMQQRGLIEAHVVEPDGEPPAVAMVHGLTWDGYDWLDATRNDTIWTKTKQLVEEKGGGASFDVLKAIAVKFAFMHFGLSGTS
jgi:hypothetical protein